MKQFLLQAWEVIEVFLIALVSIFLIYKFLAQPFQVRGESMEPNFSNKDYLLIDEVTYHFQEPERGDVIVFRYPSDRKEFYIKRLIGLPGEKVVIRDGTVTVVNEEYPDGFRIDEAYLPESIETAGNEEFTLGEGQYFVLGDNRPQSFDSRSWGVLPENNIIGKVRLRFLPLNELEVF